MAGLFSGLGKKATKEQKTEIKGTAVNATRAQLATNKDQTTDQKTEKNTVSSTEIDPSNQYDRSTSMRIGKTPPAKPENDFDLPSETIIPNFASSSVGKTNTSEVRSLGPSAVIGPKITFKGELTGEEDLLIEGNVEGTIELKNHHLTIGKQGIVKANVSAKSITVEGAIEGDLTAVDRISIKSSSNVKGNVSADRVTLEDGAKFRGSIEMDPKGASTSKPAAKPFGGSSETHSEKV